MSEDLGLTFDEIDQLAKEVVEEHLLAAVDGDPISVRAVNDARLAVRLISADGDVLWSTTQESKGAKYKGASADVAEQVVKQLIRDLDKLQAAGN